MTIDRDRIFDLLAQYGALIDTAQYEEWLGLFASECRYQVMPRENWQRGLPAALMFCEGESRLFATGLYRDTLVLPGGGLRIADKSLFFLTPSPIQSRSAGPRPQTTSSPPSHASAEEPSTSRSNVHRNFRIGTLAQLMQ
jgi:hypothetical protein